jgi:sigma-B regulation protein RsbU (phosphoserine phosphatase)
LRTASAAIGAMPDIRKNTHIAAEDGTLCIFSDGVYEIEKADGTMWQLSEFIEFMRKWSKADLLDNLFQHVQRINSKDGFEDDFTILAATFR